MYRNRGVKQTVGWTVSSTGCRFARVYYHFHCYSDGIHMHTSSRERESSNRGFYGTPENTILKSESIESERKMDFPTQSYLTYETLVFSLVGWLFNTARIRLPASNRLLYNIHKCRLVLSAVDFDSNDVAPFFPLLLCLFVVVRFKRWHFLTQICHI